LAPPTRPKWAHSGGIHVGTFEPILELELAAGKLPEQLGGLGVPSCARFPTGGFWLLSHGVRSMSSGGLLTTNRIFKLSLTSDAGLLAMNS
jgi:hypothetical protein